MLTKEDLQMLSKLMEEKLDEKLDEKLKPINGRLNSIEEQLAEIKEDTEVTRSVLNEVIKWIDVNFRDDYPFPVEDKQAI